MSGVRAERVDALVIGAGPAGASGACVLARQLGSGGRVLLVERSAWPREKVCGCCLGPAGVRLIDRHELVAWEPAPWTPVDAAEVRVGREACEVAHPGGRAMARSVLDGAIVRSAVEAGAAFRSETIARVAQREENGWLVELMRGGEPSGLVHAPVVIAADGLTGSSISAIPELATRIARGGWIGVSTTLEDGSLRDLREGVVRMHVGPGGYAGLVRLPGERFALAAAVDPRVAKARGGAGALIEAILRDAGSVCDLRERRLSGTGYLTRERARVALPGLLVVGDAAGYVEPFTGEGMTWAIASGVEAGLLGAQAVRGRLAIERVAAAWERWHAHEIRGRYVVCRGVRWVAHRPMAARVVVRAIGTTTGGNVAGAIASAIRRGYRVAGGAL